MIAAFIFFLHVLGAAYAFTKSFCEHKLTDAFMTLAFVGIIFSVGWTIAGFIVRFFFPEGGFAIWMGSDTISLIIVTILEGVFQAVYFRTQRNGSRSPSVQV